MVFILSLDKYSIMDEGLIERLYIDVVRGLPEDCLSRGLRARTSTVPRSYVKMVWVILRLGARRRALLESKCGAVVLSQKSADIKLALLRYLQHKPAREV